jgi:hypothetical protein
MPREDQEDDVGYFDPRTEEDRTTDFERILAQAVEKKLPLVAIGRPGEQIGR